MLPPVLVPHPHVVCNEEGIPLVKGTRVPVRRLWVWHRRGVLCDTLWKRYPAIPPGAILDALSFGYDNIDLINADLAREEAILNKDADPIPGAMEQVSLFRK
jgi:uncharacterized protein (DUF433 family)